MRYDILQITNVWNAPNWQDSYIFGKANIIISSTGNNHSVVLSILSREVMINQSTDKTNESEIFLLLYYIESIPDLDYINFTKPE